MYASRPMSDKEYKKLVKTIREGYTGKDGCRRLPNNQVADILVLEANLGCRINDIVSLTADNFQRKDGVWKIIKNEQKTRKNREFVISDELKAFIDGIIEKGYSDGVKLFSISAAAVWKVMRQVTDYLDMGQISTHSLRKMAGLSLLDATDGDFAAVCTFYQHSNIRQTTAYLRRSDRHMENALKKITNLA